MTTGESAQPLGIVLYGQSSFEQLTSQLIAKENEKRIERETSAKETDFFTGPNGKTMLAKYKNWIGTNKREEKLYGIGDKQLRNAISQTYRRNAFIGDGGTAAVIKFEKATGLKLGRNGGDHVQKGKETIARLKKILKRKDLTTLERATAESIIRDISNALGE